MIGLRDQNLELLLLLLLTIDQRIFFNSQFYTTLIYSLFLAFNLVLVVDFIQDIHWYSKHV